MLQPKQEIKWLGVWFDSKLLFNSQLQHIKRAGEYTLSQLRRLSKCYSGLSPREIKKLVTTILCPRIFYGSIVWFTEKTFSKANKIISSLQNASLNLILGAFRGSSTDLMYHDSYSIPFHVTITKRNNWFYLKKLTSPDDHPTRNFIMNELNTSSNKHKSPIQDTTDIGFLRELAELEIETIYPYSFPPWTKTRSQVHNLDLSKDEAIEKIPKQVEEEVKKGSMVVFTDGSASEDGGGAAAVSATQHRSLSVKKTRIFSNHEMELLGILSASQLAKEYIRINSNHFPSLAIFSDNQGVLRLVNDIPHSTSGQHLIIKIQTLFRQLPPDTTIKLFWTPGHAGIELNEKADSLAKQASMEQQNDYWLPASLGSLKRRIKSSSSPRIFPFRPGSKPYATRAKDIAESLMNMEKGRSAVIAQLRASHSPLNDHLFKRQLADSPLCSFCGVRETTEHFLIFCRKYRKDRWRFRNRLREEEVRVNWKSATKLLDTPKAFYLLSEFVLATHCFIFFILMLRTNHKEVS